MCVRHRNKKGYSSVWPPDSAPLEIYILISSTFLTLDRIRHRISLCGRYRRRLRLLGHDLRLGRRRSTFSSRPADTPAGTVGSSVSVHHFDSSSPSIDGTRCRFRDAPRASAGWPRVAPDFIVRRPRVNRRRGCIRLYHRCDDASSEPPWNGDRVPRSPARRPSDRDHPRSPS